MHMCAPLLVLIFFLHLPNRYYSKNMDGSGSCRPTEEDSSKDDGVSTSDPTLKSKRVATLNSALEHIVNKLTSKNKMWDCIKDSYLSVYRHDSVKVLALYKAMMSQMEEMMREEFSEQCKSNNVYQQLADIDSLSPVSDTVINSWRPSSDPDRDLQDHLRVTTEKEIQCLKKVLSALQQQNKVLNESCQAEDEKLKNSLAHLQNTTTQWDGAAAAISDDIRKTLINDIAMKE